MKTTSKTTLNVTGMTCSSCVKHINQALGEVEGVHDVEVKMRDGQVTVQHDFEKTSIDQLIEALNDAGYEGRAVS